MPLKDAHYRWGPVHLNSNSICAIDIRTGGPNAIATDLLEVAIIPVNHSFKMHEEFTPFITKIRPVWKPDWEYAGVSSDKIEQYENAPDSVRAIEMFENWCETSLQLKPQKMIYPLVFGWERIAPFLKNWLGFVGEQMITDCIRDNQHLMNFYNDRASIWGDDALFVNNTFAGFLKRLDINLIERNSLLANCKANIDAYNKMLRRFIPGYASKGSVNGGR